MKITNDAENNYKKLFGDYNGSEILKNDPELFELFSNFALDQVVNQDDLDDKTRIISNLATLIGCQGVDLYKEMVIGALNVGVTPVEIKEIVYQAIAYLGMGRVYPFIKATNKVLEDKGIKLPLEGQSTTNQETRLEKGIQAQVDIFGENMKEFYKSGPEESRHINLYLAGNCFGDYYTRGGLDLKQRELVTFCYISAQGGCEDQLIAHSTANMNLGNDKNFLIKIITQNIPYIGYPRSLNALKCVNTAFNQLTNNN